MDVEALGNYLLAPNSLDDSNEPVPFNAEFIVTTSPPDSSFHLPLLTLSPLSSPPTPSSTSSPNPLPNISPPTTYSPSSLTLTPPLYTPSPPSTVSSPQDPSPSKKRKQDYSDSPTENVREWKEYSLLPQCFQIHDSITLQPLTEHLDVTAQQIGSKFTFSESEDAWICYRQNQFKVFCLFRSPQPMETMCVNDGGIPKRIGSMCAKLYAINEVKGGILRDELRIGLHHAGKKRVKSSKLDVEITPFEKGKIEFINLQFERSNAAKPQQPQQEYFHIIVVLYAECQGTFYPITGKISPRIVVRGQNPGFYDAHSKNPASNIESAETNFVATSSVNLPVNYRTFTPSPPTSSSSHSLAPSAPLSPKTSSYGTFTSSLSSSSTNISLPPPTPPPPPLLEDVKFDPKELVLFNPSNINEMEDIYQGIREEAEKEGWKCVSDKVYHYGNVGINTSEPKEALHVQGNIMVTGTMYKPSDMRIKSQVEAVDTKLQLGNVRKLRIYDYLVESRNERERGVIAQELAQVIPQAVHEVGDVKVNDTIVPNLLVVNERMLLYENIGATQQLDKDLETEKENIVDIHAKVSDISETNSKTREQVHKVTQELLDVFFREEEHKNKDVKVSYLGLEEEYISFGISVFKMGPARSLFVIGHFAPFAWILGSLYLFSNIKQRKVLGLTSLLRYIVFMTLTILVETNVLGEQTVLNNYYGSLSAGFGMLIGNYIRHRRNLKKSPRNKTELQGILAGIKTEPPEVPYKYLIF